MQNKISEIPGKTYGKLTALEIVGKDNQGLNMVRCECECGKTTLVRASNLLRKRTSSCYDCSRNYKNIHGLTNHPIHTLWMNMKGRVFNKNNEAFKNYGERGINICDEWLNDFQNFYDWCINSGWQKGLDIDREDNNGIYEPGNCRFVTRKINVRNRRLTVRVVYNNINYCLAELCEQFKINLKLVESRLRRGWDIEKAIIR